MLLLILLSIWAVSAIERPCPELSPELRHFPCNCVLLSSPEDDTGGTIDENADPTQIGVSMSCDGATFSAETPQLPRGAPIYRYRHKNAGLRSPPLQLFTTGTPLAPLRVIDLSNNSMRRLSGGQLHALRDTLSEVHLSDNLLGDTLNPILSTGEFRGLTQLKKLDVSRNGIRALEAGILRGCDQLRELILDGNRLNTVPSSELGGPVSLQYLSLKNNLITELSGRIQIPQLEILDLSGNQMELIRGGVFGGIPKLKHLWLSSNRLTRFDSDAFEGPSLVSLDLSNNYLSTFPGVALTRHATTLTHLDISSNRIKQLNNQLEKFTRLHSLNLSRNEISTLPPGTFTGLDRLRHLDLGVNSLRAIEDGAFEGLESLESLVLIDNNILLIPSALGHLQKLKVLKLDYNRIAAISGDIVGSVAESIREISLARNVIREIPDGTFRRCKNLEKLDLSGNLLSGVQSPVVFSGSEDTLKELDLSFNKLTGVANGLVFMRLESLDLSNNRLGGLSPGVFGRMAELKHLNLSGNPRLGLGLSIEVFNSRQRLRSLDLSQIGLRSVPIGLLRTTHSLTYLNLGRNGITEIPDRAFVDLTNLTYIDLSGNKIGSIRPHAFVNVMSIRTLLLRDNRLVSYGGESFNTGTGLEHLDLSSNRLAYLSPTSFRIHPRLKILRLNDNRMTYFPAGELISGLQYLELLDLTSNKLSSIEELDFARLPRIRTLKLSDNQLEFINDLAFHNSTQLQYLDLSNNQLNRFGERSLEGLIRLRLLNLSGNNLVEISDTLFDRSRIQAIDSIDLSHNNFVVAPLRTLRRQHFALADVNLSHNKLTTIPPDDTVLVNVETLDLSNNPLSEEALSSILGEPKTVRILNLSKTGLKTIKGRLETPFLRHLNLSSNNITEIDRNAFERTSLLETLDLNQNLIRELSKIGTPPVGLNTLIVSNNPIERISVGDLNGFTSVQTLDISHLDLCSRIEKDAFTSLKKLTNLNAFDYPRLGYLDVKGLLKHLPGLEKLNIECMDAIFGASSESTTSELHPVRLAELGIHGNRLNAIAPGALSGLRSPKLTVRLQHTSLTSLPPTIFFPVPRSTEVTLDITGSQLNSIPQQLLTAIDDRRGRLTVLGLDTIPLNCDCTAKTLKQYITNSYNKHDWIPSLRCSTPERLNNSLLLDLSEDQLICMSETSQKPETTRSRLTTSTTKTTSVTSPAEPDIIWSVEPRPPSRSRLPATAATGPQPNSTPNNDDTLIIGIVGGVVSFIAILIIGICIVRLKMNSGGHHHPRPMSMSGPGSICACSSVKGAPSLYATYQPHAATLCRSPVSPVSVYQQQPYFIPYPPLPPDDKMSHR